LWRRIKDYGVKLGIDRRLGSEVGRLSLLGELTDTEAAAAFLVAEIYGRFERAEGRRRSARSPSYEIGQGGEPGEMADEEQRARRARKQFFRLQACLPAYPGGGRTVLEQVCCEDRSINSRHLDDLRGLLARVAAEFGLAAKGTVPLHGGRKHRAFRDEDVKPSARLVDPKAASDRAETVQLLEERQRRRAGALLGDRCGIYTSGEPGKETS
jgi:hypothetical protein